MSAPGDPLGAIAIGELYCASAGPFESTAPSGQRKDRDFPSNGNEMGERTHSDDRWINRRQIDAIQYLKAENRLLKEGIRGVMGGIGQLQVIGQHAVATETDWCPRVPSRRRA
jgi:hypothetical protein